MDELYSNLENYNEVNIVEELKNENKELKYKLEECSNAINQLQTDFDKLNSEYKKLEVNYSSLLKTARAEIERKTQLITNLNREKDILVIRSMQNGQKNILNNLTHNINREAHNKKNKNVDNKEIQNFNKNKPVVKAEAREVSREPHLPSPIESLSSVGTTNKSTSSENNIRSTVAKHSTDSKENILKNVLDQQHKERQTNNTKSKKIMDRRKSMPVLSNWEEQFSSDEEQICEIKRHQDYENKNVTAYGKTKKISEQSNYETKNKYANDRYIDKYNPHSDIQIRSRHRVHYRHSPERDRFKPLRINDHSNRSNYRQRVLKSPPPEKYNPMKSHNRRCRDYEWDYDNIRHNTRHDYNCEERSYIREPDHKRRRIESTSTDTEKIDRFVDKKSFKHSEYSFGINDDNYTSCQSPDHDHIESNIAQHYVKEIKGTSSVQLEDPRISSKKYLLNKSDKGTFINVVDINVRMKPIDKSWWGLEKVDVPEALKGNPSTATTNDELLKYIYMDIDEPVSDICQQNESGELEDDIPIQTDTHTLNEFNCKDEINLIKTYQERDQDARSKDFRAQEEEPRTLPGHYKIPKKSKADTKENILHKEEVNKKETHTNVKSLKKCEKTSSINKVGGIKDSRIIEKSSKVELKNKDQRPTKEDLEGDLELSECSEASDIIDDIQSIDKYDNKLNVDITLNVQNKVAEVCRVKEDHKHGPAVEKNKHVQKKKRVESECIMEDKNKTECNTKLPREICNEKKTENIGELQKLNCNIESIQKIPEVNDKKIIKEEIPKQIDEYKKKSSKKKRDEKIAERSDECEIPKAHSKDAKKREKKKRHSKDDTDKQLQENVVISKHLEKNIEDDLKDSKPKTKFTELFGESSSLITPDDLGIAAKCDINIERNDNYGSLFENTQDAIDLNVGEIQKIHNTAKITSDECLPAKTPTDGNPQIPCVIENKSILDVEDKHNSCNAFKNLKPAPIDTESNIVQTVVISSGVQSCSKEKKMDPKSLAELKSENRLERLPHIQLPVELLKAVATSTPNKTQFEITSRLSDESTTNPESMSKYDISLSNAGQSPAIHFDGLESNAPDVRIFLKRRRKIKKT